LTGATQTGVAGIEGTNDAVVTADLHAGTLRLDARVQVRALVAIVANGIEVRIRASHCGVARVFGARVPVAAWYVVRKADAADGQVASVNRAPDPVIAGRIRRGMCAMQVRLTHVFGTSDCVVARSALALPTRADIAALQPTAEDITVRRARSTIADIPAVEALGAIATMTSTAIGTALLSIARSQAHALSVLALLRLGTPLGKLPSGTIRCTLLDALPRAAPLARFA